MDKLLTIDQVAQILNVTTTTLRTWDNNGTFPALRTNGKHRRYKESDVLNFLGEKIEHPQDIVEEVCIYGRVSSHDQKQKGDLDRQCQRLSDYCAKNSYKVSHILKDVGSGLSDTRVNLQKLLKLVTGKLISKVIIEHKDRLTRFQFNLFEFFFQSYGVEIIVVEQKADKEENEELVEDLMMLMASFSGKIYGRRSAQRRKAS